ncbi:MAG: nucleotidyltransferase family protein [Acidobacteria bacterium]|nr:nucleotidyltransferase family protein [Acidobacteriota bacterium]
MFLKDPDFELMLRAVRAWLKDEQFSEVLTPGAWEYARWHRLDGVLAFLSDPVLLRNRVMEEMQDEALLMELASAFNGEQIGFITFKGLENSRRFHWQPGVRRAKDIDLLVEPDKRDMAIELMEKLGFAFPDHVVYLKRGFDVEHSVICVRQNRIVDLHWRMDSPAYPFVSVGDVFSHTTSLFLGSVQIPVLTPDMEFAYLVYHGSKHLWYRLHWLVDLCAFVRSCPLTPEIIQRIHESGQHRSYLVANGLTTKLFDFPICDPDEAPAVSTDRVEYVVSFWQKGARHHPVSIQMTPFQLFRANLQFTSSGLLKWKRLWAALTHPTNSDLQVFGGFLSRFPWIVVLRPMRVLFASLGRK